MGPNNGQKLPFTPPKFIPDEVWESLRPHIPEGAPPQPWHRPRAPKTLPTRACLTLSPGRPPADPYLVANVIYFILTTGAQWHVVRKEAFGVGRSTAHAYFQYWVQQSVFFKNWVQSLIAYDQHQGIAWEFQPVDGSMVKAPLGGEKNRAEPHRPRKTGREALHSHRRPGHPAEHRDRRS